LAIEFPELLTQTYTKKQALRYGENPHQSASYYERLDVFDNLEFTQIHGKALSYNNINDMTGALRTLQDFNRPTAVAVKHANACAIASGDTILDAYTKAFESDPVSIFGGIVALNEGVDLELAKLLNAIFLEIVIAPSFSEAALEILQAKKNIRLICMKEFSESRSTTGKDVLNGKLLQEVDGKGPLNLKVVSKRKPTEKEMADLEFAWKCVKNVDSNAIVLAKDEETLALGHGEVRRIWSVEKAIARSVKPVDGSVMASDAFFFEDSVEACAAAGIRAIIQPGGSIHDSKVIELCDTYNIALVMSGVRHFKH
jgi:phosphoribosylaminoimidazolecarboxamide formyltransferase / IMP cyclohydrolase